MARREDKSLDALICKYPLYSSFIASIYLHISHKEIKIEEHIVPQTCWLTYWFMSLVSETQPEPFPLNHTKSHENNGTEIPHGEVMHAFCLTNIGLTLKYLIIQTLKSLSNHTGNTCSAPTKTQKKTGVKRSHPFGFLSALTIKLP